ncbi:hypothetical protein [Hymenobacter sp. BT730]|uniref:hypothetical protein n=1 Tax=Hymenobacter sp. BT730 TaxID=3063332 RepID=UPI0026E081F2|nr:hypothetical protein [Hymenobacter sp. BT730]
MTLCCFGSNRSFALEFADYQPQPGVWMSHRLWCVTRGVMTLLFALMLLTEGAQPPQNMPYI